MPAPTRIGSCILVSAVLLLRCGGTSSTQADGSQRPDSVNAELDTVAPRIDYTEQNDRLRATLASGSCTQWKQRGDPLHAGLLRITERLERMRSSMALRPIDDMQVADSVYLTNGEGEHAYNDLRSFYAVALRSAADTAALKKTERLAMQVLTFPTAEAWRQQCFNHVSRLAASTILSKITTDALLLENSCLHSILKACERSVGGSPFPEKDSTTNTLVVDSPKVR